MTTHPQPPTARPTARGQASDRPQGCGPTKAPLTWENGESSTIHTPYYDYYIDISKNQKK